MYERKLTVARSASGASTRWYRPYHAALAAEIDALHRAFGAVWHINCHSMPAVGDANADDPGRERADFVLGDRDGTTCEPEFTALVARRDPRAWATRWRSTTRTRVSKSCGGMDGRRPGRHSLQIELNRRLYMDEATLEPNAHYSELEADLERLVAAVASYVRARIGKTT